LGKRVRLRVSDEEIDVMTYYYPVVRRHQIQGHESAADASEL